MDNNANTSSTEWAYISKNGVGVTYDQIGLAYDAELDNLSGRRLMYDQSGQATTWTYTNKS